MDTQRAHRHGPDSCWNDPQADCPRLDDGLYPIVLHYPIGRGPGHMCIRCGKQFKEDRHGNLNHLDSRFDFPE